MTLILMIFTMEICFASTPYNSYSYNRRAESYPTLAGYLPEEVLVGQDFGTTNLTSPRDIFFDKLGNLYVADTGSNRILIIGSNMKVKKIIDKFMNNGSEDKFNAPEGVFVTKDNKIFVADTQNGRLVVLDKDGNLLNIYGKPEINDLVTKIDYKPQKVAVDDSGRIFVVSIGNLNGLIQLDTEGKFNKFFGSNRVEPNFAERMLRKFLSKEQISKRAMIVPIEYSNVSVDDQGFLYTSTRNVNANQIKRLNYQGDNIIRQSNTTGSRYGDLEYSQTNSQFIDVAADSSDNVYALDNSTGKIFMYSGYGDLLFAFGGGGAGATEAKGLFKNAVAIEHRGDRVYVLDESYGTVTVFKTTEFGKTVLTANDLYMEGKYAESMEPWKKVLKVNSKYVLANKGLGNALLMQGDYKEAMKYLKLGLTVREYSKAFREYRSEFLRDNFSLLMTSIIVLIAAVSYLKRFLKKRKAALEIRIKGNLG